MAFANHFTMQIPTNTALLPIDFHAPPEIREELRCIPDSLVQEYSDRDETFRLRKIRCVPFNSRAAPWMQANPTPNWDITFQSKQIIYGTQYWIDYEPDGLLEYLQERAREYHLIYKRKTYKMT